MSGAEIALAGLAVSVGGTVMSAVAQKKQSKQQAKWQEYNAAVEEGRAKSEERASLIEQERTRAEATRDRSRRIALFNKAGVSAEVGSPLLNIQDSAIAAETDARLLSLAGRERAGFRRAEAGLLRSQAKATKRAGRTAFATTLLTGLGGAALQFGALKSAQTAQRKATIGRLFV